jgi:hypothetical protein
MTALAEAPATLPETCYDFIKDEQINNARPFPGYNMWDRTAWPLRYRVWPDAVADWPDSLYGAAHAYHIQQLSLIMRHVGWVGPPPVGPRGKPGIIDGHHRVRVIRYLRDRGLGAVEMPGIAEIDAR